MIAGNGIDRNKYQGITVYSGASNALVTNTFHSNGTAKDNTYAHIDVGQNVAQVCISNNNFSPLDSDVTNVACFCVYVAPGATRVIGDIGAVDPTTARAITNAAAGAAPWTAASNIGAVIQGSGNDILTLRNSSADPDHQGHPGRQLRALRRRIAVHPARQPRVRRLRPIKADAYLVSLISGRVNTSQIATQNFAGQTAPIATWLGPDGTSVLGGVDAGGAVMVNGVAGATAGARFAGGTKSGAPTSGSWKAGDYVIDQTGKVWIYTGSAWVASGGAAGGGVTVDNTSLPLADAIVATPGNSAQAAPANHQHPRTYWNPSDQGLVTWTMDVMTATANSILPAQGTLYVVRVHVPVAATARNILAAITNAGSGLRSGQCFAGVWNASGGARVGVTADQSTSWATTGVKTMALTGAVNLTAGDYYIGLYANGTTLPNFARGNNQIGGAFANAGMSGNFRVATANTGLTTTPPPTLGTLTASNTAWWLALS